MGPEEITEIVYKNLLEIIGWTIATIAPVITSLIVALGLLWSKLGKKDEEIKRLNLAIVDMQKEYHESLKSLSPYFEKSAEAQSRTYDICENILNIISRLDVDETAEIKKAIIELKESLHHKNEDIVSVKHKIDAVISILGSKNAK